MATEMPAGSRMDRRCPACGGTRRLALERYTRPGWDLVSCQDCGFVYLHDPVTYEMLESEFAWEKASRKETEYRLAKHGVRAKVSRASRWRLGLLGRGRDHLLKYFSQGNVLDIGCGPGGVLMKAGGVPHGIEISRELAQLADKRMRARGGYAVHAPAIEGLASFPDGFFSAVLMNSYLEHETEPKAILRSVGRVLAPGGIIYVRVPNFGSLNRRFMGANWCGFRFPDHVNYFTLSSLTRMAREEGYSVRLLNPHNLVFDDNIKVLLTRT